ncbi:MULTISPECIES: hypothetical protein [Roseomonadaceae]|uniref:Uncharacterized protein n=1 Tax=Falsiroseomonas oleicola TaxID=2801474 RepID=A0ABS6H5M1_9PROT|nr:hypothetical protein [Roseomonas oleicola]MBU8543982.1 hypothetical protein [Roseomonas oleicola]
MRPIVAVRAGIPDRWMVVGDDGFGIAYPAEFADPVSGLPRDHEEIDLCCLLSGAEVVDLLACDFRLSRPPRALTGMASALGDPHGEVAMRATESAPLRVAASVADVLFGGRVAVLPLGDDAARAAYLRGAAAVTAPDLASARAMKKLLEVPVAMPKLFVAA